MTKADAMLLAGDDCSDEYMYAIIETLPPEFHAAMGRLLNSPAGQRMLMFGQHALTDEARAACRGLRHFCSTNTEPPPCPDDPSASS